MHSHHRCTCAFLSLLLAASCVRAAAQVRTRNANDIPPKVLQTLNARFPNAKVEKCTREKEGGIFLYDIEFRQGTQKLEADIRDDGTLDNWAKEIPSADLPAAVRTTVYARYPKAAVKEAMAVTSVRDGRESLEGYEVTLATGARVTKEMTIAPDGKILEDSGKKK